MMNSQQQQQQQQQGGSTAPATTTNTPTTTTAMNHNNNNNNTPMMSMSMKHQFTQSLHNYWELNNDFVPLQDAGMMINAALRNDEEQSNADLYRKIVVVGGGSTNSSSSSSSSNNAIGSSHLYFPYDPTNTGLGSTVDNNSSYNNNNNSSTNGLLYGKQHNALSTVSLPPPPEQTMEHVKSIPLPSMLVEKLQTVRMYSSMGLFVPSSSHLAYMIVDHQLFIWSYADQLTSAVVDIDTATTSVSSSSSIISFVIPSGQCIISVGLVPPKKGVFKSNVEWCIVVATPEEVLLCALKRAGAGDTFMSVNGGTATTPPPTTPTTTNASSRRSSSSFEPDRNTGDVGPLKLVPTSFSLSTDNVRILSIAGSENGRIFLGGEDGCLYEMTYQLDTSDTSIAIDDYYGETGMKIKQQLEQFYDHDDIIVPEVIVEEETSDMVKLGKRAWSTFKTATLLVDQQQRQQQEPRPRKCAKINRTVQTPMIVKAIVPDFVLRGTAMIIGGPSSAAGGKIIQIVIDEHRGCIYTLSTLGWICSFDLNHTARSHSNINDSSVMLSAVIDTPRTARLYLEAVSRGQGFPPSLSSTASQTIGHITFPGGGIAAQAGVGGMDGARTILKHEDMIRQQAINGDNFRGNGGNVLKPISIHVIVPTESSRLTLLAVTEGGLRFYLSSLTTQVISDGADAVMAGRYGTRAVRNPLTPSNRITLCHIRSPPPNDIDQMREQDFSSDTLGVVGGITPRLSRSIAPPLLHSSLYKHGVFVMATADSDRIINATSTRPSVADMIVIACPDTVARKLEVNMSSTTLDKSKQVDNSMSTYASVGGISESVSISRKFPGGIVCDIVDVSIDARAVCDLIANSTTPSDNELSIGLPPPYYSPSKTTPQERVASLTNGNSNMNERSNPLVNTLVSVNTSGSTAAFKVFGNVVANILLSRPLRYGISVAQPVQHEMFESDEQPKYRISSRITAKGFSGTAGEGSLGSNPQMSMVSKQHIHSRSARLRPWLLRPSTIPLNHIATHVYTRKMDLVALNTGGLHFFGQKSVLAKLAEALIRTTNNVSDDNTITSFFNGYGYNEGCCMCIALAIGCGAASGSVSERLKSRAISAALARAYVPKLVIRPEQTGGPFLSGVLPKDPLIPDGYEFKSSALCEGLVALFSRLVRPIWHKPAVVVTEGRMIKLRWSNKMVQSPAKVEIIFDDVTLQEMGGLLRNLLMLMKSVFSRAIKTVPGFSPHTSNYMDIDDQGDNNILTKSIQYNVNLRNASSGMSVQLSHHEAEHIARQLEEKTLHSMYRVLARVVQLLNLMSLLRRAEDMVEFKEVDWGLLHGLTMSQLVQFPEAQDRLENLLNSLVTTSVSRQSHSFSVTSAQSDKLANLFADQCYLFFSPASRYAYLGFRSANEAMSLPMFSPNRNALIIQAAQYLRQAATHWHSEPLVTGRMIPAKGKESFSQMARRAIESGSPLARATDTLMDLEDVVNVVEVCLITASNFAEKSSIHGSISGSFEGNYELTWEHNLYHKRRDEFLPDTGGSGNLRSPSAKNSSSAIVALGTHVTGKAAIECCYALIFHHLSTLFSAGKSGLADSMVSSCAAASDLTFLQAFFTYLLENDHADTLLRIDSAALCQWLIKKDDPEILWRYYNIQGRHREAGQVAFLKAKDRNKLALDDRIEWLLRSMNSYESATDGRLGNSATGDIEDSNLRAKEVGDTLQVAQLQHRILTAIDLMSLKETSTELYEKLVNDLVSVSELYNEYAAAFSLFDECLMIFHACRFEDAKTIQTLWTNIICEEILPCATRSEVLYRFLRDLVASVELNDMITLVRGNEENQSFRLLEEGDWEKSLVRRITTLGRNLYGKGASYVFPVEFLLFNLEQIKQSLPRLLSPGWSLLIIADAGVPFLLTVDAYESVVLRNDRIFLGGNDVDKNIEKISALLELLEYWVVLASSGSKSFRGPRNESFQEMSTAIASGLLMRKIEDIKQKIEMMPEASRSLLGRLHSIEHNIRFLM